MLFRLDFQSAVPIYRQIRDQVVLAVAEGRLLPGEHLPTTRALAEDAGINVMTVSKAYQLLKSEGYLTADRRSGAVVCTPPGGKALTAAQLSRLAAGGRGTAGWAFQRRISGAVRRSVWRNGGLNHVSLHVSCR